MRIRRAVTVGLAPSSHREAGLISREVQEFVNAFTELLNVFDGDDGSRHLFALAMAPESSAFEPHPESPLGWLTS
ncbi:MAG TPA: hypothetical protein EYG03_17910 [Planctomycetes bacterium]|nr:hypothetical protein [Fuerstiella sp.]HIK93827.1 hypothetical protein [Planctomycetota bacterium]